MKNRITIISCNCKRCGKKLATTNQSIYGLDANKKNFGIVCSDCVTEEEKREIMGEMKMAMKELAAKYQS